jgi:hypothetical protein
MSSRFDLIAQQLLQKDFEQCTIDELVQYAEAHPFLSPAQFLLVKKLQQQQDPAFKIRAQKAALYYHQPVAFEAFLLASEPAFATPESPGETLPKEKIEAPAAIIETEVEIEEPPAEELAVIDSEPASIQTQAEAQQEGETKIEVPIAAEIGQENGEPPIKMPALPQLNKEVAADAPLFEPYHTVDYFASQGIKLSQEELPKDKFGKQLMSFTAWLKTMKKLPPSEQAKGIDPQAEEKVEHLAAHSVSSPEVVTETMAEVWIKQGQPQKAAEVYRKLSLLHPSKKVYFAAKIQNLTQ